MRSSIEETRIRIAASRALVIAGLSLWSSMIQAGDYQIHGFLAQGFVLSEGNNLYGDSTNGSFDYCEAGLNGTFTLTQRLLVSAQGLIREAGETDDGQPRIDFAFADYRFLQEGDAAFGTRVGRVKNAFGFYNETRDVVFTRPSIVLPFPAYFETSGARALLFSADGLQVYGGVSIGDHYLSLAATAYAPDSKLTSAQEDRLGFVSEYGDIWLRDFHSAKLQDDWDGGRWSAALSYAHGALTYDPDVATATDFEVDFDLIMLSLRYSGERFGVVSEYAINKFSGRYLTRGFTVTTDTISDGLYIQFDYRLTPQWTFFSRYEGSFVDHGDRDGSECQDAAGAPQDRHACFTHDVSAGMNWQPTKHWGFWGEYHIIDGLSSVSLQDNMGRSLDPHWSMLVLMAAYRF